MDSNPQISPETIELIESYLLNTMDAQQKEAFEKRLEAEPELRAQTNELQLISRAIQEQSLRDKLHVFHAAMKSGSNEVNPVPGKPAIIRTMAWHKWAAAAGVLLIFMAAWFILNQPSREQRIYSDFYQADPGLVTTMGGNEQYEFNHAMIDYKTGKYDSAIVAWKRLQTLNPGSDTLNYFIGSSYMALDNAGAALTYFELVARDPESMFRSDAYWYAALSYLKLGRKEDALKYVGQTSHKDKEALTAELIK